MKFTKMHGLGNDFIFVAGEAAKLKNPADTARKLCDRRTGIGADGLVLLLPSEYADSGMRIYNADGSEAEMCGNALRCAARYLVERGLARGPVVTIDTRASLKKAALLPGGLVRADMGPPILESTAIPVSGSSRPVIGEEITAGGARFRYTAVSMGNPHCVIFLDPGQEAPVITIGPLLERHPNFPKGANIEFCRVLNRGEVKVAVWERGAGETAACGTGACAVVVAGVLLGLLERKAAVHLPGGTLQIEWTAAGPVCMEGPAVTVFEGEMGEGTVPPQIDEGGEAL
ncbi:MAG: diaminopimelate epimerase [Bacillota bacterium]